jgi:glycosyltransferase involved in cell wall biosynthesis
MKMIVFSPYYPPHIGGLESHADEFNKYLSQKNTTITVFTSQLPYDAPEKEIKYEKVKILRFPAFEIIPNYPLPKFWLPKFWKLFAGLFDKKFDIAISRTMFFNTSLMALFYAKIKKVKWVHIEHGSDYSKLSSLFKTWVNILYIHIFGKLVLYFSDKNIANSQASARFCKKILKNKDCSVIYRGVEIEKIKKILPAIEIKNKYPNKTIITFFGRLIDGKGVSDLIRAVAKIENDFALFIIGDGPQKGNLEKLSIRLNLSNKVIFYGHQNWIKTISLLKISDIFVNPSYTEGLPTAVIESALCKKAIIATNVGGTPEIITNGISGFLIEPKNINSLKEKLELLINDNNLRENIGNNAYTEVANKFDWEKSIKKYLEIFGKL